MTLQETIKGSLKEAMMAKDAVRMTVIRGLMSAFTNELVALGRTPQDALTDDEVLAVIRRGVKQRKDAIEQFVAGGRDDLADSEKAELALLEVYLPAMMPREEIQKIAEAKKVELGIDDKSKSGMLMSTLMKELKGKADGADVKAVVEGLF
ncbi:MAG: GatB/YqeY domain-containing protein [Candidatus Pacebacteria bacterium]|nr:GatB/YqeY domain-containing protein [Candidatus Paceibacterota bacterium]MBP9818859.1 GatB/YqeY domain-containing protein [Candidatus Paceibacterota bacterium]